MIDESLLMELVERVKNRFYGKYRGSVTDVDASTMRIRAQVPSVLGATKTGWCDACVPYAGPNVGMLMLPEIGTGVWIEFEAGDVSHPIWVGCYWRRDEVPANASEKIKTLITSAGELQFDTDANTVTLSEGDDKAVFADGITITGGSGKILLDASGVNVNDGNLTVDA